MPNIPSKKKVVLIFSHKGGVGKSTFARAFLAVARRGGVQVLAYDGDAKVAQLAAHEGLRNASGEYDALKNEEDPFEGVLKVDVRARNEQVRIAEALDFGARNILMDFPGGSIDDIKGVFGSVLRFKQEIGREGYELVVVYAINQLLASAASIPELIDIWGATGAEDEAPVTFMVVKSASSESSVGEPFIFFDGEQAARAGNPARRLEAIDGIVFDMPRLQDDTYALIDADQMPLLLAASAEKRPAYFASSVPYARGHRSRVAGFLGDFESRLKGTGLFPDLGQKE